MKHVARNLAMAVGLAAAGMAPSAKAATITQTPAVAPSLLETCVLSYSGATTDETPVTAVPGTLRLGLYSNNTLDMHFFNNSQYDMDRVGISLPGDITATLITIPAGYAGSVLNTQNTSYGSAGNTQYSLHFAPPRPGEQGIPQFENARFTLQLSAPTTLASILAQPGNFPMHWQQGPRDDSTNSSPDCYNCTPESPIPEPTSSALTGGGILGLAYAANRLRKS